MVHSIDLILRDFDNAAKTYPKWVIANFSDKQVWALE